jgi:dTDP-glucose 4,6-dehydratase
MEFKIARCFAFLGPHLPLDQASAIGNFIGNALAGKPIQVNGDGTPLRSYLYAADLAVWLWTILFKGAPGRVYNVGGAKVFSITEVAAMVRNVLAPQAAIHVAQKAAMHRPPSRYLADVTRASQELGLKDWVQLDEAIRRTGQWAALPIQDRMGR